MSGADAVLGIARPRLRGPTHDRFRRDHAVGFLLRAIHVSVPRKVREPKTIALSYHRAPQRGRGGSFAECGQSLMRMRVSGRGVFVSELAMFVSCRCVLLGFFMLAKRVMMLGLVVMMRGSVVISRCLMVMVA